MVKDINIHKFYELFKKNYNFLYDNYDRVAGYNQAAEAYDKFLKEHKDFVVEFVNYRGDFITSDREAAAFMLTLDDLS